jgi:RNA-binding protein Musashi
LYQSVSSQIDPKRAIPKKDDSRTDKLFVRNIPQGVTQPMFQDFFAKFGVLSDCTLMMDRASNTHRGFGFVTYKSEETVDEVVRNQPYTFLGQQVRLLLALPLNCVQGSAQIEVRKSAPRGRDDEEGGFGGGRGRGRGRGGPPSGNNAWGHNAYGGGAAQGSMASMPANMGAGFDPTAMAEYFKQMGWGQMNPMMMMNPMMFGMMGMGGAGAGAGAPAAGGAMDPAQQAQWAQWSSMYGGQQQQQQPGSSIPAANNAFGMPRDAGGPPPNAPVRRVGLEFFYSILYADWTSWRWKRLRWTG